jgi:hypothetical protein
MRLLSISDRPPRQWSWPDLTGVAYGQSVTGEYDIIMVTLQSNWESKLRWGIDSPSNKNRDKLRSCIQNPPN